jgi:hypothetical protein
MELQSTRLGREENAVRALVEEEDQVDLTAD